MRAAVLAMLLVGCGGCGGSQTTGAGEPGASATGPETTRFERAQRTETSEHAPDPSPPPVLTVRGAPDRHGQVAIAIENRGTTTTSLATAIAIEAQRGESWEPLERATLTSRPDCSHEAPTCQELAPGAALVPPAWLGTIGAAQCACDRCARAPDGRYRFVVHTCDGAHTIPGEAFELTR